MADANYDGVKVHDINKVDNTNMLVTTIVGIIAGGGVITGLTAMYLHASILICVAFAFPLITAPYLIAQRRQIQWLPSKFFVEGGAD